MNERRSLNELLGGSIANAVESQPESLGEAQDAVVGDNYYNSDRAELAQDNTTYRGEDIPRPVDGGIGYSRDYEVNIRPITSGYILRVGCQEIAVESGLDVAKLIQIYLSGDKEIGDKWMKSDKIVQNFIKENLQVK